MIISTVVMCDCSPVWYGSPAANRISVLVVQNGGILADSHSQRVDNVRLHQVPPAVPPVLALRELQSIDLVPRSKLLSQGFAASDGISVGESELLSAWREK